MRDIEKEHERGSWLHRILQRLGIRKKLKFIITRNESNLWLVVAVNKVTRARLCPAWGGLRGPDLAEVSGFTDAEFVHKGGFVGGAWSKETAIAMALVSISDSECRASS